MYIVAIAWVYVIGIVALGMRTFAGGVGLFLALGLGPLVVLAWMTGLRGRRQSVGVVDQGPHRGNGGDPQSDEDDLVEGGAQVDALV